MDFKKMSSDEQVKYLKKLIGAGKDSVTGHIAVSAFKHYLILKEHPECQLKPVLRWYLGQLAKEFIKKFYREAKENLENFAAIGLLDTKSGEYNAVNEYSLNKKGFPALRDALEAVFGKEYIGKVVAGIKFYRTPEPKRFNGKVDNSQEVGKNVKSNKG